MNMGVLMTTSKHQAGRKTLKQFFSLIITFVALTSSCINVDHEFTLNDDGSGEMKVFVATEQEFYESEGFGTAGEEIAYVFEEITYLEGFTLIDEKEYDSRGMHVWELSYAFDDIRKLSNENYQVTLGPDGKNIVLSVKVALVNENNPGLTEEELATEEIQEFLADLANYRYKLQMKVPRPIKEAPGAEVDGRTASWEIKLDRVLNPEKKKMRLIIIY